MRQNFIMSFPTLNGYNIIRELAMGGMAQIYDAIQISLNRPVAIKFLSKSLLDHHEAMSLFERESLIIAKLNHPNIVQVIDKGISIESLPYFVMEKINGIDLAELIAGAELPQSKKIDIAIQICRGLSYAHKNNVIHRDIKPSNIIIDNHGNAKILDFGIALSEFDSRSKQKNSSIIGTIGYFAPELENNTINATITSDIFSFGMLLKNLFSELQITETSNLSSSSSNCHSNTQDSIKQLIAKCILTEPSNRYSSLTEIKDVLLGISRGSHLEKSKRSQARKDTKDISNKFNLLDILHKSRNKSVYLFQKKSNRQLIIIKRQVGDGSGYKQARILSSIKHPNIIQIIAASKSNGCFVLITEYLNGGALSTQMIQGLSQQDFLRQACQICSAIHFAHQNNILHSNLSPKVLFFDNRQNIKVSDFGQTQSSEERNKAVSLYHPPGQQNLSEQYDIYCLGAIFHHMIYGVPFGKTVSNASSVATFRLQKLIDKMLSINPIDRPTTVQQVLLELQRIARSGLSNTLASNISKKRPLKSKHTRSEIIKVVSLLGIMGFFFVIAMKIKGVF